MSDMTAPELKEYFPTASPAVLESLADLLKAYPQSPEDLSYRFSALTWRLDPGNKKNLASNISPELVEDLRRDMQESLERERKPSAIGTAGKLKNKRKLVGTGAADSSDLELDFLATPVGKRRASTRPPASSPAGPASSPAGTPSRQYQRGGASGTVLETLNPNIAADGTADQTGHSRVKLTAQTEFKKYAYRSLHQKLLDSAEYLNDRIEQFVELVQQNYNLTEADFGDPATQSQAELVAVGRIVSDSLHAGATSKLNLDSVALESCRRLGGGSRVRLNVEALLAHGVVFFPGQIVAFRGSNPSGDVFVVSTFYQLPALPPPVTPAPALAAHAARQGTAPLRVVLAKGPYTPRDNLRYEPLADLVEQTVAQRADVAILLGPFVDLGHPLVAAGALPPDDDVTTLDDLFRKHVTPHLRRLDEAGVLTLVVPDAAAEAVARHVSFPQPPLVARSTRAADPDTRRALLGAGSDDDHDGRLRHVKFLTNPAFVALNETTFAIANVDILMQLSRVEGVFTVPGAPAAALGGGVLTRGVKHVLEQRSVYPVFPAQQVPEDDPEAEGPPAAVPPTVSLETGYLGLAEIAGVRPDVLVLPSNLHHFAKVVDNVVAVNPGSLMKANAAGSYCLLTIAPPGPPAGTEPQLHRTYDRCRVDVKRI
ncbi:DNA polymerase alpha subunit B N-terminal-domain-containing protein [Dipodascopsis tothii]|uniref:DNA polymerase alpha subunit B N-terminal-domain-containing protein n=1 Tax=Dipodascopsis tothii TaxID=44089 RepID=UPI0034CED61E